MGGLQTTFFHPGIEWALSRDPERFYRVQHDYFLWKLDDVIPGLPQIEILYRYNAVYSTVLHREAAISA
jgi:hypothetical protein